MGERRKGRKLSCFVCWWWVQPIPLSLRLNQTYPHPTTHLASFTQPSPHHFMGREDILWKSRWTWQKFKVNQGVKGYWEEGKQKESWGREVRFEFETQGPGVMTFISFTLPILIDQMLQMPYRCPCLPLVMNPIRRTWFVSTWWHADNDQLALLEIKASGVETAPLNKWVPLISTYQRHKSL
jgi:hypothetical protein